jgi:hypothetical protein
MAPNKAVHSTSHALTSIFFGSNQYVLDSVQSQIKWRIPFDK